jgi:2-dehydropantoate 2-reductase
MKVAIVGAGAIGGVVAWHLRKAGQDPVVVARPSTAALLSSEGLTLQTGGGSETLAIRATSDATALGPQDLVMVGYKAHDWTGGLDLLKPLVGPDTLVVPMLNGIPWWYLDGLDPRFGDRTLASVDSDGALAAAIPTAQVLGCVVYVGSNRPAPNRIDWNGRKRLILGEPLSTATPRLHRVVELLKAGGIDAEATDDIRTAVWHKLLGNAAFNPISAVTGATIDVIAGDPPLRALARSIMNECIAVARSFGVADLPDPDQRLQMPPTMIGVKTSMLQDMEAGRPLELGAIVSAIGELGRRTKTPTPLLDAIDALAAARWRQRWAESR